MKTRKIIEISSIIVILILVTSSMGVFGISLEHNPINKPSKTNTIKLFQQFSSLEVKDNRDFLNIHLKETNSFLSIPGEPILPIYIEKYEFPLGTRIKEIKCSCSAINKIKITKDITPSAKPTVDYTNENTVEIEINKKIYSINSLYPENWYSYKLVGGRNRENRLTTFLTIQINPIRYNPVEKNLCFIDSINIEITYEEPSEPLIHADEFDLLIISYDFYAPLLKPLIDHKTKNGIRTKLVTLGKIYRDKSNGGRDKAEKIKYYIKDAIENWNITYVMLVGDFRRVPVRYANLVTDLGGIYEELKFASDLYYADIYDSGGNFSSWDTNNNDVFGEWPYPNTHKMEDIVDLAPEVYVGRLACMFSFEVKSMVEKIIEYENSTNNSDWFKNMIVCGGDTFDKKYEYGTDYDEGEVANEKALEYMTSFNHIRLYASLGNLTTENIHNEISNGSGFLYFVGHGSPRKWATFYHGDYGNYTDSYENKHMYKLKNDGMYPILMVGGCHNSEFVVAPINLIKGFLKEGFKFFVFNENHIGSYYLSKWVLECWSWVFVKINSGGAIASMGSVGYGGVKTGDRNGNDIPDCIEGLDGWFETQFFRLYNEEKIDILGDTYYQAITDYINNFPVYEDRYDCKIVETHVLLGDPSLKIGGY